MAASGFSSGRQVFLVPAPSFTALYTPRAALGGAITLAMKFTVVLGFFLSCAMLFLSQICSLAEFAA